MPPLFPDKEPWFPVKRFGYGAGLPIARQGWFLVLAYVAAMVGLGFVSTRVSGLALALGRGRLRLRLAPNGRGGGR